MKKVKARGGDVNPWAVCRHALNRSSRKLRKSSEQVNPVPMGHGAIEGVHVKPLLIIVGAAAGLGLLLYMAQPAKAATSPQPTPKQQGGPPLPLGLPPPPGEVYAS